MLPHRRRIGYCAQTDVGGDCGSGHLGAWEGVPSLEACAEKCRGCARCRFVSFSRKFSDCSWYSACTRTHSEIPHQPPGAGNSYTTVEVKAPVPLLNRARGCRQLYQGKWAEGTRSIGKPADCASDTRLLAGSVPPVVVVSSAGQAAWERAESTSFAGTILQSAVGAPLWVILAGLDPT